MRLSTLCFVAFCLLFISLTTDAVSDVRQRFEGLVGKNVQAAWRKIDKEAPGRPIEIMRQSSSQTQKAITPGYVRVILDDQTGRVLYTPILQPN